MEKDETIVEVFNDTPEQKRRRSFILRFVGTFLAFIFDGFRRYLRQRIVPIVVLVTWLVFFGILGVELLFSQNYVTDYWVLKIFGSHAVWWYELADWMLRNLAFSLTTVFLLTALVLFVCRALLNYRGMVALAFRHILRVVAGVPIFVFLLAMVIWTGVGTFSEDYGNVQTFASRAGDLGEFSENNLPKFWILTEKIEKDDEFYKNRTVAEKLAVNTEVGNFIKLQNGPLTVEQHKLRNYLNIAPVSLDEMLAGESDFRWRILTPFESAYHMFGEDGEYNLKFLSVDGHFEAVYNLAGELLTVENDPDNAATYNFAPSGKLHTEFDVKPYYLWGNDGEGTDFSRSDIVRNVTKFFANKDAQRRYEDIKARVIETYGEI
ncbi:MAG: hypothetical protein LBM97_02585 [Candidatus Nomurabacteria bacterium]|jgi:hypothetical protein|nr:hypothetical protein [Candidatus Nomurabacteria bacterium]